MDRKQHQESSEMMTCDLCGEKFHVDDNEGRIFHVITRHPLEAIQTKSFVKTISGISYKLGEKLANRIFK